MIYFHDVQGSQALALVSTVEDAGYLQQHARERGRARRGPAERPQGRPRAAHPGHVVEHLRAERVVILVESVDQVAQGRRPAFTAVVDGKVSGRLSDEARTQVRLQLVAVLVVRPADDVRLNLAYRGPVPGDVLRRVVGPDTAALHQPHEAEVEVLGQALATPAGHVAVEQGLAGGDHRGPVGAAVGAGG